MTQNKTLTDEAFEKWYANSTQRILVHSAVTYETSKQAWQAAKQETAKEITELNNSMGKLVEVIAACADLNISYRKTISELENQIEAYRTSRDAALQEKLSARSTS